MMEGTQLIQDSLRKVCEAEIPKYQTEDYHGLVPRPLFSAFSSLGVTGLSIPEQYGGLGTSASLSALVMENIAEYDLGPAIFLSVHAMVSGLITKHGTTKQHEDYLPKLARGELLAAFALTEPNAGSDAAAITTTATQEGDFYIINGDKCYITSAGFADLYLVFARTSGGKEPSISAFLLPSTLPGITASKPEKKMGCELSPIASLYFHNVKVSADNLLGSLHEGFKVALSGLAGGRVNIAACANGISKAAIEKVRSHLLSRKQFGQALYEFQGLQFIFADMYCKYEAAKLVTTKACKELDGDASLSPAGVNTKCSSSVAKCIATDAAMSISTDAVQLLGGAGYMKDFGVERLMREAKMLQIVEGSNQIQRMIIARELKP